MKNSWTLTSIIVGLVSGAIGYLLTGSWRLALVIAVVATIITVFNNPKRRYIKAFWAVIAMILVLNRFFFEIVTSFSDTYIKAGSNEASDVLSISLVIVAIICLVLDYLERKEVYTGSLLKINKNKAGNVGRDNYQVNQILSGDNNTNITIIISNGSTLSENITEMVGRLSKDERSEFEILKKKVDDLEKAKGYLDTEVIHLKDLLAQREKQINENEQRYAKILQDINGKNLTETPDLFAEAYESFLSGNFENVLKKLSRQKMLEATEKSLEQKLELADAWILRAEILQVESKFELVEECYEMAIEIHPSWDNLQKAGHFSYTVGELKTAEIYYSRALENAQTKYQRGTSYHSLCLIHSSWYSPKATSYGQNALELFQALHLKGGRNLTAEIASVYNTLGTIYWQESRFAEALRAYDEARINFQLLIIQDPDSYLFELGNVLNNISSLFGVQGRSKEALDVSKESEEIFRKYATVNPEKFAPYLARTLNNLGLIYSNDEHAIDDALEVLLEAKTIFESFEKRNPKEYLPSVAMIQNNLGKVYIKKGELGTAEELYLNTSEVFEALVKVDSKAFLPDLGLAYHNVGKRGITGISKMGKR